VFLCQNREDAIDFAQFVGAKDDSLIAVVRHCKSIAEAQPNSTEASCELLY
jgi:hypothetical protein